MKKNMNACESRFCITRNVSVSGANKNTPYDIFLFFSFPMNKLSGRNKLLRCFIMILIS